MTYNEERQHLMLQVSRARPWTGDGWTVYSVWSFRPAVDGSQSEAA